MNETRSADRLLASAASDGTPPKLTRNTGAISTGLAPGESREYPEVIGYEILGVLGHDGMGVVYRARQFKARRLVALKMIRAVEHGSSCQAAYRDCDAPAYRSYHLGFRLTRVPIR